jgi:hypothetical protein
MAKEWAEVPAYGEALEQMHGPGSLATVIEDLGRRADELRAHGHRLFGRWLDVSPTA